MIIFLDLHPIKAYVVANHGCPRINGYLPRLGLGCKTMKFAGYSHESIVMNKSSMIPFFFTIDISSSCRTVVVCLRSIS